MACVESIEGVSDKIWDQEWVIPNWSDVIRSSSRANNTKTKVKCIFENEVYAEFEVGTKVTPPNLISNQCIRFYWKLLNKHHGLENLQSEVAIEVFRQNGTHSYNFKKEANAVIGETQEMDRDFFKFLFKGDVSMQTNLEGSLVVKLKVTLKNFLDIFSYYKFEFDRISTAELITNFATLLDDECNSDLKILTKDKNEFLAHKAILCARCPVFASMFRSKFMEGNSNSVKLDDISAKTMRILLKYWYTGILEPPWEDNQVVLESTYAAGKYQMTQVLNMLNNMLGTNNKLSSVDVELLKMVQMLTLKNAEARLLKRIVNKISNITSGAEWLDMFPLPAGALDEENFPASQTFKSFDDYLSEEDDKDACALDVKFMAMACKLGMKNVENTLCSISIARKIKSANFLSLNRSS